MKKIQFFRFFLIGFIFLFAMGVAVHLQRRPQAVTSSRPVGAPTDAVGSVSLKQRLSVQEVLKMASDAKLEVAMVESDFAVGKQTLHDFFPIQTKQDAATLESSYRQNRSAFLADMLGSKAKLSGKQLSDMASQFADMEAAQKAADIGKVQITKVLFKGAQTNLNGLKNLNTVDRVDVATDIPERKTFQELDVNRGVEALTSDQAKEVTAIQAVTPQLKDGTLMGSPRSNMPILNTVSSLPNSGTSYTGQSTNNERYTTQYMRWGSVNFTDQQTYEHDFFLYNYDRQTYLSTATSSVPWCLPQFTYAATSWPSSTLPYIDTRTLFPQKYACEQDEMVYTIGAAQANRIQPNVTYYNYIRTTNGNANSDRFKLQGQIGHRSPSFCYSTFCIYPDSTTNFIPAWSSNVPGVQSWTYGLPAAPSNVYINVPTTNSLRVNFKDNEVNETATWIERKIGSGGWNTYGYFSSLSGAGYWYWTNTGLARGTNYCYRLRSAIGGTYSNYSNEACGRTL